MEGLLNISPIYASILVTLLPFLAFLVQAIAGKSNTSGNIGLIALVISTFLSAFGVFLPIWNSTELTDKITWFTVGHQSFSIGILLNNLTVLMQLIVCLISLPVHIYSRAYMKGDKGIHRYWMYLSLFCFAMLGLTVSANLIQLYICWELVGFASYLLIGFWFTKDSAVQANKKAFLINKIGDIGFLIGIALVYTHCHTVDIIELFGKSGIFSGNFSTTAFSDSHWITLAGLAFFTGAMAKSAQFPLHVWLPDAMEGPTSVSSLIHAATMVAAGVFLLCTVFPIFNETVLLVITIVGCITAFIGAIFAMGQYDIKRVLAFSTISQLGFMVVGVGIGAWDTAMFHLVAHAFFKCLLFLSAGAVIHEMHLFKEHAHLDFDAQDLRHMGGLRRYMPKTFICMTVASLALIGFPLTSGYLSKDSIVISAFEWGSHHGATYLIIPITLIVVSILTAFYIGRLVFKTFFGTFAHIGRVTEQAKLHEAPGLMRWPMCFLAACSLFPVFSLHPFDYHQAWLMKGLHVNTAFPAIEPAHVLIPILLTISAILAGFLGWSWYVKKKYPFTENNRWVRFTNHQGYLNELNQKIFVRGLALLSKAAHAFDIHVLEGSNIALSKGTRQLSKFVHLFDRYVVDGITKLFAWLTRKLASANHWFDKYIIDGSVNLLANTTYYLGHLVRQVQNGQLQGYLSFALTVVVLGILYLIIK